MHVQSRQIFQPHSVGCMVLHSSVQYRLAMMEGGQGALVYLQGVDPTKNNPILHLPPLVPRDYQITLKRVYGNSPKGF